MSFSECDSVKRPSSGFRQHLSDYRCHYGWGFVVVSLLVVFLVYQHNVVKGRSQEITAMPETTPPAEVSAPPSSELTIDTNTIFPEDRIDFVFARLHQTTFDPTLRLDNIILDETNHLLFVAEKANNRVLVYNLDVNNHETGPFPNIVLGQTSLSSNASVTTQSGFNAPAALAYDKTNHRLFVSDSGNNRVLIFNTSNLSINQAASNVLGQRDFESSLASPMPDGLNNPGRLTFDSQNNQLSVRDEGNNREAIFDLSDIMDGQPATDIQPMRPDFLLVAPRPSAE
jgi:DNA-binding beta-propeller fold protein YncE